MQQSYKEGSLGQGQPWRSTPSERISEAGLGNRLYDSRCSHCFVLQKLFDSFNHHRGMDILNGGHNRQESKLHLEFVDYFQRHCGCLFETFVNSFLSCFAVQVSVTLLHLAYSWSTQAIALLNDLLAGETWYSHLQETKCCASNLEIV